MGSGPERNTGRSSEAALVPGPQGPQGPPAPPTPDAAVVDDTTSAGPAPATPPAASPVGPAPRPRGPMRPEPTEAVQADSQVNEGVTAVSRPQVAPMDFLSRQRRVSWDQLKDNLAQVQWKEEGVPGAKQFDD